MKTKSAIRDMFCGIRGMRWTVKPTKREKELIDQIFRFDFLIRKSLVFLPNILEQYQTIINLFERINIESTNNYYAEGFKFGVSMGMEITGKD